MHLKNECLLEDTCAGKANDVEFTSQAQIYEKDSKSLSLNNGNHLATKASTSPTFGTKPNYALENFAEESSQSTFSKYVNFLSSDSSPKLGNTKTSKENILGNSRKEMSRHHLMAPLKKASSNEFDSDDLDDYKESSLSIENKTTTPQTFSSTVPSQLNGPKCSIKRHNPLDDVQLNSELNKLVEHKSSKPPMKASTIKVTIEPTSDSVSLNDQELCQQQQHQQRQGAAESLIGQTKVPSCLNISGILGGGVGSGMDKFTTTRHSSSSAPKNESFKKKLSNHLNIKGKLANSINLNASTTFLANDIGFLKANSPNKNNLTRASLNSAANSPLEHVGHLNADDPIEKHMKNCECEDCRMRNELNNEDLNEPKPTYSYLKSYFVSMLQPSDNKLAMKLFGSKKGVLKEKARQQKFSHWVVHPCSNFR